MINNHVYDKLVLLLLPTMRSDSAEIFKLSGAHQFICSLRAHWNVDMWLLINYEGLIKSLSFFYT